MGTIVMGIAGVGLAIFGVLVRFNKKISLIPAITEERLLKIKKVDKVAKDFGNSLFIMAGAVIIMTLGMYYFGTVGGLAGLVLTVASAGSWNSLANSVDDKIKKRIY
ncbi:hypothetical protein ACQPU1_11515 [Clostridium paraputrificum]|uniref:hypothetical protein n=1 Tax=Clostridium TaxID=1485 RepID=UPI003D32731B